MRYATVHACVRVLSEDVAALPLHVYRRTPEGGKERAREHPLYELLHDQPNPDMTSSTLREAMMVSLLLTGNAYVFLEFARSGRVKAMWPLDAAVTRPFRTKSAELRFRSDGAELSAAEVLHIPGLSFDGLLGLSPISYAREAIGLGLSAEQFGSRFFRDGTHLGGAISVPGTLSDEGFERTKTQFSEQYSGMQRSHKVVLLEGGATFTPFGIPPEDAQFLETRKFQRSEIAAIFRVPPHLIGDLERATFSNIEHQDLAYLQRTLLPWLVRIEQGLRWKVLPENERQRFVIEHDTGGFMRGDTKSRMEAYSIAINAGIMTRNEARQRENLNPVQGGDELLQPLNMIPAGLVPGKPKPPGDPDGGRSFPAGAERRSAEEDKAALEFAGVTGDQYDAMLAAVRSWLAGHAAEILKLADRTLARRSFDNGLPFVSAAKAYFSNIGKHMPEDLQRACAGIAMDVHAELAERLGDKAPPVQWFRDKLKYYCQDATERMNRQLELEIEKFVFAASDRGILTADAAERYLASWDATKAEAIAKNEAAMVRNRFLNRGYRKAGFQTVWRSSPTCCALCQSMDGAVVYKIAPPLHKGCVCSVAQGDPLPPRADLQTLPTDANVEVGLSNLLHDRIIDGTYPLDIRWSLQSIHLEDDPSFMAAKLQRELAGKSPPSYFSKNYDVGAFVKGSAGNGDSVTIGKGGGLQEFFNRIGFVGWVFDLKSGGYVEAHSIQVKYSTRGAHAFPVLDAPD